MPIATKPTKRQTRAMALITNGVKPTQAMILSGYSRGVAKNPKQNLLDKPQVKPLLDQYKAELNKQGINLEYRVTKLKQFLEANKEDQADYKTQLEALKILNDIDGIKDISKQPKRRMTIEEFEDTEATELSEA